MFKQLGKERPNINKWQNDLVKCTLNAHLANRFQTLEDIYTDPKDAWMHMKENYNEIATTVLGHSHKQAEEWITEKTWE